MSIKILLATAMLLIGASGANAEQANLDNQRQNFLRNLVSAMFLEKRCTSLHANDQLISELASALDIPLADVRPHGPYWSIMGKALSQMEEALEGADEATACAVGREFYGPKGLSMPNMLLDKAR